MLHAIAIAMIAPMFSLCDCQSAARTPHSIRGRMPVAYAPKSSSPTRFWPMKYLEVADGLIALG